MMFRHEIRNAIVNGISKIGLQPGVDFIKVGHTAQIALYTSKKLLESWA